VGAAPPATREIFVHYPDGIGVSKLRIPVAKSGTARRMPAAGSAAGGLVLNFYIEPQFSYVRDSIIYGGDTIGLGCACYEQRIRPNGTVIPRNAFIAPAQNRTDVRLQQKINIGGRRSFDLIADVFNVFNRPNWTVGENEATVAQFGQHTNGTFRQMQVGFRLTY